MRPPRSAHRLFGRAAAMLAACVLAACTVATVETPDPGVIPSGEPRALGPAATGPIVVVGEGRASGVGWRFVVYDSADGICTQIETGSLTSTGCGDQLPAEGRIFGGVGQNASDEASFRPISGFVTRDIATVWMIDDQTQRRVPAELLPLDEADLEAQAFIGFPPDGLNVTHLQAMRRSGEIVETYELP